MESTKLVQRREKDVTSLKAQLISGNTGIIVSACYEIKLLSLDLKEWMIHNPSAPETTQALIFRLKNWYNDDPATQGCLLATAQLSIG